MYNYKHSEFLNGLLLASFFLLVVSYMTWGMLAYHALALIILIIFFILSGDYKFRRLVLLASLFLIVNQFLLMIRDNSSLSNAYVFNTLMGFIISYYVISCRFKIVLLNITYVLIGLFFLYKLLLMINSYGTGSFVNESFFEGTRSSANYVSVVMIGFLSIIYLIEYLQKGKFSIWLSFFCLFVCFFSICRSGIACSFLLILVVVFKKVKDRKLFLAYLAIILLVAFYFVSIYYGDFVEMIVGMIESKSDSNYIDNPRNVFLSSFLQRFDALTMFYGIDLNNIPAIRAYNGNPHNSIILAVSNWGVLSLLFFVLVFNSIVFLFKRSVVMSLIFIVVLMRSCFDAIFSGLVFDFVYYTFVLLPIVKLDSSASI